MKTLIYSRILRVFFCLIIPLAVCSLKTEAQPVLHWGSVTNGLQLGINQGDQYCMVFIRNLSAVQGANYKGVYIHCAPPEIRYEMKLLDPQGKSVEVIPEKLLSLRSSFEHGGSLITNRMDQIISFSAADIFKIQTNGLHTLIVSGRFTTNQVFPKISFPLSLLYPAEKPPTYFLLPPVTNTFNISTNDIRR
jgi:hypothetical protein